MYGYEYLDFQETYHLYLSFNQSPCPDKEALRENKLEIDVTLQKSKDWFYELLSS